MEIIMLLNSVQALLEKLTPDHPGFHRDWVWAQAMLEQATGMLDPSVLSQWLGENLAQIALSNPHKHRTAEQHLSPDLQEFVCPKSGSNSPATMPSEVSSLASCPPPSPTWAKVTGEKSQDYLKNLKRHISQVVDSASDLEEEGFAEEYFDSDTHKVHSEIEEREETLDAKTISSTQKQSHGEDSTICDVLTPSSRGSGSFSNLYNISKKHEDIGEPSEDENDWESIFGASETGPERSFVSSPAPSPEEESQWQEMRRVEL
ncbi:hypothetical protein B0O99DRAFT_635257 [Bisporella sp. PMI_857]|nr:hypothetical protein B0O99DRAFT_635257 [Bisporella sp. PMI_857]